MALTDNIVSYWKLDESSGNAADSAGSNTLVNNNTVTYVAAKINNGAHFVAASSQGFSLADASQTGLDGWTDFTVAGWLRLTSDVIQLFANKRNPTGNQRSYTLYYTGATHTLSADIYSNGSTGSSVNVAWTPSTATLYHVAFVRSGTSLLFYVNGAQQGTTQTVFSGAIYNSTAQFEVGQFAAAPEYNNGDLDELGIWSRALSGAEITELYNGGAGFQYPFTTATSGKNFFMFF